MPPTSPLAWESGLPIERVMSAPISSVRASIFARARSHSAMRSSTDMLASARAALRAASSVRSSEASSVTGTSNVSPVYGLSSV